VLRGIELSPENAATLKMAKMVVVNDLQAVSPEFDLDVLRFFSWIISRLPA
jgi:hypothetical protein